MVIQSTYNYEQYLKELEEEFKSRYGEKYSQKYIEFIREKNDPFKRVFLDKNIMWKFRDDYATVRHGNILFYLCVGVGFVGKTTFFKNAAYFFDTKFDNRMLCWSFSELIDKLEIVAKEDEKYRAILVDEPNDFPHPQSREGKKFAEIIGQARQLSPILFFCSTDFKDMPPTIVRKTHGLFYLNTQGHGYFICNDPQANLYPLDEFKKKFSKEGYKIIGDIIKKYSCLEFQTLAACVIDYIDSEGQADYLKQKKNQFIKSVRDFKRIKEKSFGMFKHMTDEEKEARFKRIVEMKQAGLAHNEIARKLNLSTRWITELLKEFS